MTREQLDAIRRRFDSGLSLEYDETEDLLAEVERLTADIDAALAEHNTTLLSEECDESKAIWRAYANRELSEDEAKAKLAALEVK